MSLVTTRGTAKTLAKTLLDEKSDTFFSQTNQNNLVDEANRIVWRELINTNYEYFLDTDTFTFPANAERISIDDETGDTPYKIIDIGHTPSSGAITPNNSFNGDQCDLWSDTRFKSQVPRVEGQWAVTTSL